MKIDLEKIKQQKSMKELLQFGILNIDKPSGMTSFDVSHLVGKALGLKKTSHFGVLDPMVTGVLPVALGRAVKLTGFFIGEDKEYAGEMLIHEDVSEKAVKEMIKERFLGKIIQMPPVRSNVKRQEREREIKKFEIIGKEGKRFSFLVECQGGTYIRKLVHDFGEALGTGAHMTKLRRTRAGIFTEKNSVSLDDFEKAAEEFSRGNEKPLRKMVLPAEIVSELYPVVEIKSDDMKHILTGKPIHKTDLAGSGKFEKGTLVCIFSQGKFVEIARVANEGDIFSMPEFVLQPV